MVRGSPWGRARRSEARERRSDREHEGLLLSRRRSNRGCLGNRPGGRWCGRRTGGCGVVRRLRRGSTFGDSDLEPVGALSHPRERRRQSMPIRSCAAPTWLADHMLDCRQGEPSFDRPTQKCCSRGTPTPGTTLTVDTPIIRTQRRIRCKWTATMTERNTRPHHRPRRRPRINHGRQLPPALRQTQATETLRSSIQPGMVRTLIEIPRLRVNRTRQHRRRRNNGTHAATLDVERARDALVNASYSSNRS